MGKQWHREHPRFQEERQNFQLSNQEENKTIHESKQLHRLPKELFLGPSAPPWPPLQELPLHVQSLPLSPTCYSSNTLRLAADDEVALPLLFLWQQALSCLESIHLIEASITYILKQFLLEGPTIWNARIARLGNHLSFFTSTLG